MYNIKGGNDDFRTSPGAARQKYDSGDDFHMDYLVGRRFGPWGVGLSGYYLKQTGDDKIDGKVIDALPGVWGRWFAPSSTATARRVFTGSPEGANRPTSRRPAAPRAR